jgi:putative PEP-CTERM system histidine kinase
MTALSWVELMAASAGIAVAMTVALSPRLGPGSWTLSAFLLAGAFSAGVLATGSWFGIQPLRSVFLALEGLVFCSSIGCFASYTFGRKDGAEGFRSKRYLLAAILLSAPAVVAGLQVNAPPMTGHSIVQLGPAGYGTGLYLLLLSVVGLANVEQILRSAEDHVRWEIKFMWLGIGANFAAFVYVAAQILVYPPAYAYVPTEAVSLFPIVFCCSCLLILQSWRRGTRRRQIAVSHGVVYSTITFLSVGIYLVIASLVAGRADDWWEIGAPVEAVVFLLSLVILSALLLTTAVRHRIRLWIRRNVFAGRYDYRRFWLAATEQIRANEPIELAAEALVKLVQDAIASMDLSVWIQSRNSSALRLVAARGSIREQLPKEVMEVADQLSMSAEPMSLTDPAWQALKEQHAELVRLTKAAIFVPLVSSGRLVGLMTVGADRSGKAFDWQTREFLGAVAVHFANEFHKSVLLSDEVEARETQAFQVFSTFLLHDLKNFATTLSLIAKNAVRHHGNPGFQSDAFDSILELSEKMKSLCNHLRTFSTTLAANKATEDLNQIVSSVAEAFESTVGRPVRLDLEPTPPIMLDREEISRALHNLMLNAHEASADNGIIELRTRREPRGVVVTIADQGRGMSPEFFQKALSQPFHTTKRDGWGVGLFQSRKIVEAHDGTMEIESTVGAGTLVRIIFPLPTHTLDADSGSGPLPQLRSGAKILSFSRGS